MPTFTSPFGGATPADAPLTSDDWYLKDPVDPTRNIAIDVIGDTFEQESTEERATYKPLGRKNPIIVADVVRGEEFDLKMEFVTRAGYNAFEVLRLSQRKLLLQRGYTGDQWYVRLGSTRRLSITSHGPPLWRVSIPALEVDAP